MALPRTSWRWLAFGLAALLAGCAGLWGPKSVDISQAQLQHALDRQFPIERRVLERWSVRVLTPRLSFDAASQRMSTELVFELGDDRSQRTHRGRITIRHGVRFEASDATVRLTQPQIVRLEADDAPLMMEGPLARAARAWVEQGFDDRVVYTLSSNDVQTLRSHGWMPAGLSVGENGLRVTLVPIAPG